MAEGNARSVHLQADLAAVLAHLEKAKRPWAFSRGNAGAFYTTFSNGIKQLQTLDWKGIANNDWRNPDVKEAKQSEFLVYESFPWTCIELIGVYDQGMADEVAAIIAKAKPKPQIAIRRDWYY